MRHARPDYDRIQDPAGLIPIDEPVFLIRGKDLAAPVAVRAWADEAERIGASADIVRAARAMADFMHSYQCNVEAKVPDMPAVAQGEVKFATIVREVL